MSEGLAGTNWSDEENDTIVADYFAMLMQELAGQTPVKAHHNRSLAEQIDRSRGSIERKHMNISAVLERLGLPRIRGYAPNANFQNSLIEAIGRYLSTRTFAAMSSKGDAKLAAVRSPSSLWIGPKPAISHDDRKTTDALERLVQKFDPAARDARNRQLGKQGEELVFQHERAQLNLAGRADLARKVEWTSQESGDGAGYDIASFAPDGSSRLIEVKTTNGPAKTPFYLSENERLFSQERPEAFYLMRIHDFSNRPCGFELRPPLESYLALQPTNYRAALR